MNGPPLVPGGPFTGSLASVFIFGNRPAGRQPDVDAEAASKAGGSRVDDDPGWPRCGGRHTERSGSHVQTQAPAKGSPQLHPQGAGLPQAPVWPECRVPGLAGGPGPGVSSLEKGAAPALGWWLLVLRSLRAWPPPGLSWEDSSPSAHLAPSARDFSKLGNARTRRGSRRGCRSTARRTFHKRMFMVVFLFRNLSKNARGAPVV